MACPGAMWTVGGWMRDPRGGSDRGAARFGARGSFALGGVVSRRWGCYNPIESMSENILVCVAWPYANGSLHTGQIVGAYLPADIFARYHRALGNRVAMVSGSDMHGTPVTVRAEAEGLPPHSLASRFHQEFLEAWQRLGITFDLFTTTGTENHARVSQDIFLRLLERGHIYPAFMSLPSCAKDDRFLPHRYA